MKKVIEIDNLTAAQAIAIEDMLAVWVALGSIGGSRWTAFYADGDGNFRPKILIDGRRPSKTELLNEEDRWADSITSPKIYKMDTDTIAWKMRDSENK